MSCYYKDEFKTTKTLRAVTNPLFSAVKHWTFTLYLTLLFLKEIAVVIYKKTQNSN